MFQSFLILAIPYLGGSQRRATICVISARGLMLVIYCQRSFLAARRTDVSTWSLRFTIQVCRLVSGNESSTRAICADGLYALLLPITPGLLKDRGSTPPLIMSLSFQLHGPYIDWCETTGLLSSYTTQFVLSFETGSWKQVFSEYSFSCALWVIIFFAAWCCIWWAVQLTSV